MDHRERLGTPPPEGQPASLTGRARFARLVETPAARRLVPRRLRAAAAVAVGLAVLLMIGGGRAAGVLADWLRDQPAYRLDFGSIELDPVPPAAYGPGRAGFLERIRRAGRWPESISALDFDAEALANDLRLLSPWVARVESVRRVHPNRVVVRLAYRTPSAVLVAPRGGGGRLVLDRRATVLPAADLDPEVLAALPVIADLEAAGLPGGVEPGTAPDDPRLARALELVEVLRPGRDAFRAEGRLPWFGNVTLNRHGLYLRVTEGLFVWWDRGGAGGPGPGLGDREKWSMLREWLGEHRAEDLRDGQYLDFADGRLVVARGRGAGSD